MKNVENSFVHTWFDQIAQDFQSKVAIEHKSENITYADLRSKSDDLAEILSKLILSNNVPIGVFIPSSIQMIVSILAIFKSGNIYLQLSNFYTEKLVNVIEECQPEFLITTRFYYDSGIRDLLGDDGMSVRLVLVMEEDGTYCFDNISPRRNEEVTDLWQNENFSSNSKLLPTSPNYIFYTSGSTGKGKGIIGAHKSLAHFIEWEIREFGLRSDCRVSQLTQPSFDASLRDIFVPLCTGGTLCIPTNEERTNIFKLIEWLDSEQITLVHTVPSLFRLITKELQSFSEISSKLKALKLLMLSGEFLYGQDILNWNNWVGSQTELVNLYGATETTMIRTFQRIKELPVGKTDIIPVGIPIDNTVLAVIHEGKMCEPGEIGEIYIKTPFSSLGYIQKNLNSSVFVQNPVVKDREDIVYKTGDLGKFLDDGSLMMLGRLDDQVKINGIRVELEDIRCAVARIEGIEDPLILSIRGLDNFTELVCYYTGTKTSTGKIREELKPLMEESLIPSYFIHLSIFPLNSNGKVNKKALPDPLRNRSKECIVPPTTDTEIRLAHIWREVLSRDDIGIKSLFFDLGGTSLKAIQIMTRIYKEFKVEVRLGKILPNPSLEHLAMFIDDQINATNSKLN